MFRPSIRRLGHQLFKEPMPHEENTFARGQRAMGYTLRDIYISAAVCAGGCGLGIYSLVTAQGRVYACVDSKGVVTKGTCPTMWWNY